MADGERMLARPPRIGEEKEEAPSKNWERLLEGDWEKRMLDKEDRFLGPKVFDTVGL